MTSPERQALAKLRRENHRLRRERDILAEAAFHFIEGFCNPTRRHPPPGYLSPLECKARAIARNE